ncbi:MAG: transporter [Verrucomicrobiota bacterium]|jgi:hypothetical protein
MKTPVKICLLAVALAALPGAIQAQNDAHYGVGLEGISGATLPPPGFYFRDYNLFYTSDRLNDGDGNQVGPAALRLTTYATVPRAIWISNTKVLGGYLGGDVVVPIVYVAERYNDPHAGKFSSSTFGLGDIYAESTLSWHPGQFDIGAAVGINMPTGVSDKPTSPGLGYWGPQLTLGATWHPDAAKTWSISALNRYEINSENRDTHLTPGQAWTLEWGVSKAVTKTIDVGVVGYYQQRVTDSTGDDPTPGGVLTGASVYPYSRVAAVGPEVVFFIPSPKLWISLRYEYEFMAENRFQGNTADLVLTKAF